MADEDLLDYDEEQAEETPVAAVDEKKKDGKGPGYVSIHSSGFRDFLLKPELLRAIVDCGFEHPSQVKSLEFFWQKKLIIWLFWLKNWSLDFLTGLLNWQY